MGSPSTIFCTSCSRSSPEFSTQSTFLSQPPHSYEVFLTASHITLLCCSNLDPATLLPSVANDVPQDWLTLRDHFLTPRDDLQEMPLGKADFSRFTDNSYLKADNGKYCAGYATATRFDVAEAASLPMATSAQQTETYTLKRA